MNLCFERNAKYAKYVNKDGIINKPLSSKDVCGLIFDRKQINKLTKERLKAFKKACYKEIGNRFFCCEFRCERKIIDTPELHYQSDISESNLQIINEALAEKF